MKKEAMIARINELRKKRGAVILAHNYELGEIQDVADFQGDSLELSIRAAETDLKEHTLTDEDIIEIKEILDGYETASNFLKQHVDEKREVCEEIVKLYPDAKARKDKATYESDKNIFLSNLAVEEKKLELRVSKAREKQKEAFDEEAFRADFIAHSRFIKDKAKYEE